MQQKRPMFSAIIAAYNIEKYIKKCMDSILKIANDELEVIVVIGRETDRTNQICREYCERKNIRLIQQNGVGLSNARNCGLDKATGRYIFFIDGDDSVCPQNLKNFLNEILKLVERYKVDAVLNDFYFTTIEEKILIENKQIQTQKNKFKDKQYIEHVVTAGGTFWNTWRYLFSKDYLQKNNFYFKENSVCEDLDFAVRIMMDTDRIWFCHMPYYNYCPIRSDSLTNKKNNKMTQDSLKIQRELRKILKEKDTILSKAVLAKLDELAILCLPDVYEVDIAEKKLCAEEYKFFFRQEPVEEKHLYKLIASICKTDGIYIVSFLLYCMKKIRRKRRYKV